MSLYDDLGVRPLVNANASATKIGGTLMPKPVLEAMLEAAGAFVDMHDLQRKVSARIASLTRNEAALVCSGASAGLVLSALACMTGSDTRLLGQLLQDGPESLPRRDFVMQCGQRNPYDPALRLAGGRIVQVGNVLQTFAWELESALSEHTAAVLFFAGSHLGFGSLGLDEVIAIAHAAAVPVIVDAAAQLPPRENLWRFTERGADLVLFSGGKSLHGPQSSGLIVGRQDLIDACELHASPHQRFARAMKVGKEELVGLLAAVEWYLAKDETAERERLEAVTEEWVDALGSISGVTARRDFPGTDGKPLPRAIVSFDVSLGLTGPGVRTAMLEGEPAIDVAVAGDLSIYLNAELLRASEGDLVRDKVARIVARAALEGGDVDS